jgi:hypothetical protein
MKTSTTLKGLVFLIKHKDKEKRYEHKKKEEENPS